jgi:hypothetical protein
MTIKSKKFGARHGFLLIPVAIALAWFAKGGSLRAPMA